MLAGCEKSDETVSLYQNADDCSAANPGKSAECTTAYNNALKEAERTAPKYATREDCVAEFGEGQCQQAPAQAGMAPENQAQAQQSSGSFWMPLMAGYMMGRLASIKTVATARATGVRWRALQFLRNDAWRMDFVRFIFVFRDQW